MRRRISLLAAVLLAAGCTALNPTSLKVADTKSTSTAASGSVTPSASTSATAAPYIGQFWLTPATGSIGAVITANGSGLAANAKYDVVWQDVLGEWALSEDGGTYFGRTFTLVPNVWKSIQTDASGNFAATMPAVPEGYGFAHDVMLKQGDVVCNKATFNVSFVVTASATSSTQTFNLDANTGATAIGPVGTPIAIDVAGYGYQQYQNSWDVIYDNQYTGWISAVTTHGHAHFSIPATGQPGVHTIKILNGHMTFPYLNPEQSPSPNRPVYKFLFTTTAGAPVLPPSLDSQLLPVHAVQAPTTGPAVWFDPAEGIAGSATTVHGLGLPANTTVDLSWATLRGNHMDGGYRGLSTVVGHATTDATGKFSYAYTVPDDLGGFHALSALASGTSLASGIYQINESVEPLALHSVDHGPAGTPFFVQMHGVGWTNTENIVSLVYDNAQLGYACGANSNGNVKINLNAAGAPGAHYIDIYPGIYQGAETAPYNYEIPQLTFLDHPGAKCPALHLLFTVE